MHDPEVLVLDEPFSGLDPVGVDALAGVLLERAPPRRAGLFSSHQLDLVERLCDSVGIIDAGRMVASRHRGGTAGPGGSPATAGDRAGRAGRLGRRDPGRDVVSERRGELVLELADGADDQEVLAAASHTGRVRALPGDSQR